MSKELALSIVIGSTVAGAIKGFKTVINSVDAIGNAIDKANKKKLNIIANNKTLKRYEKGLSRLNTKLTDLIKYKHNLEVKIATARSEEKLKELQTELTKTKIAIKKVNRAKINISQRFKKAKEEIEKTDKSILKLNSHIERLHKYKTILSNQREHRERFRQNIVDTIAIGATVTAPIKVAMDFESAMADVRKVVSFNSKDELKLFSNEILKLSTKLPIAAESLASIAAAGGQLGIAKDKLLGFTKITAKMSTAFDMSATDAGDSVAKLMNIYGLSLKQTEKLGDAINHLSDNSAAKARDIVNVLARVGGTAKMFGLGATQVSALADAFLAMGKPPEIASTAINALLTKLMTANKQGKKFQRGLKDIGLDSKKLMRELKKDPNQALLSFLEKLKKFNKQKQMGILSDLFGMEYSDDIALLINGLDNYKKALKLIAKEQNYLGSMEREFQNRAATTANKMQLLKNSIAKVGISLGTLFLPVVGKTTTALSKIADVISNFIEKNPRLAKVVGSIVGGLGLMAVTTAVVGYAFSFLITGITRVISVFTLAAGKFGLFRKKTDIVNSSLCKTGMCANRANQNIKVLAKTALASVGAITAFGAAFVYLNNAIAEAGKKDIDSKRVMGKTLQELKNQEQYLKNRIKAAKEGSFLEIFLHGQNDKYKIKSLEKLLAKTQHRIKLVQSGWKPQPVTATHISKKTIKQSKEYAKKVHQIWELKIPDNKKRELLKLLANGKTIDVKILKRYQESHRIKPVVAKQNKLTNNADTTTSNQKSIKEALAKIDSKTLTVANSALADAKNTKAQIDALQSTIKAMVNRPPVTNYHVNVHVTGQNPIDVENAVKRALAQAHYIKEQRSLNDN